MSIAVAGQSSTVYIAVSLCEFTKTKQSLHDFRLKKKVKRWVNMPPIICKIKVASHSPCSMILSYQQKLLSDDVYNIYIVDLIK